MHEFDLRAADGRALHAYDVGPTGRGNELVVMWHHGTPNIGAPPQPLFATARSLGLRWIGYDRPAYGGSAPHRDASVASAADDARAVVDHLGIGRFAVFGSSGGGPRALACAALLPERVVAVVTISAPAPGRATGLDYFAGMSAGSARELRAAFRGRADLEHVLATEDFDPTSFIAADEEALAGSWSWFDGIVRAGQANGLDGMVADDLETVGPWGFDLADIRSPTLIMHGSADRMVPNSHAQWLAAHIRGAELRLYADEGHISVLNHADEALGWLSEIRSAGLGPEP